MSGPETSDFSVRRCALMPPAKKARKAPDTSAAPEREAQGGEQDSRPRGLQKEAIRGMLAEMWREDRLGTEFFNDEQKQQWQIWLDNEPDSADQVAAEDDPFPIRMPRKCIPRPRSEGGEASSSVQHEIISYSNVNGRQFSTDARRRQYQQGKPLPASSVPPGSALAVAKGDSIRTPGFDTPFYIGDVLHVESTADGYIKTVTIHYRMPEAAGQLFCNDCTKPWRLACCAQHVWDKMCERKKPCKEAAAAAGSLTGCRWTGVHEAGEIIETQLTFNSSHTLKAECKRRLAESAPVTGGWNNVLGVKSKGKNVAVPLE